MNNTRLDSSFRPRGGKIWPALIPGVQIAVLLATQYQPPLHAGTIADLQSGSRAELTLTLRQERALLYGGKLACEDYRTGLTAYCPYSRTDARRRPIIRIGVVGPAEDIDRVWRVG